MAAPRLSRKALERIAEVSRAQGMSPDEVVLQFIPAPTPQKVSAILKKAKIISKDPAALREAETRLNKMKPLMVDEEAGKVARKAAICHRDKAKTR
jgi:hypothetical protein